MPRYQVTYVDARGQSTRAHLEGASVAAVQSELARQGARDVRVHAEDVLPSQGRDLAAEARLPSATPSTHAARAARGWALTIGVFVVAAWLQWQPGAGLPLTGWIAVALAIWAVLAVSPLVLNAELNRAVLWHDWPRAARVYPWLAYNPLLRVPAVRFNLARLRAKVLAGTGHVDDALTLVARVGASTGVSPSAIEVAQSSLLLQGRRWSEAIALRRGAARRDPKMVFDAAIAMVRHGGDADEARALLASREGDALSEIERAFRGYAHGVLAIADRRFADAREHLDESLAIFRAALVAAPDDLFAVEATLGAYRAIALTQLGERDAAVALVARFEGFLRATGEEALLAQCREAIGR